jgi:cytochrome P450
VGHEPFCNSGSDTLILAAPNGNTLWSCDPAVVKQLYASPSVQVPVHLLAWLNIWGPTISTVEGETWRAHRRVITHGFNPSTNEKVWKEAIHHTNGLVSCWDQLDIGATIPNVQKLTLRLVLYILSSAQFNHRIEWKKGELNSNADRSTQSRDNDFENALFTITSKIGMIYILPRAAFKLPIRSLRKVERSLQDLTRYMQEMRLKTIQKAGEITAKRTKSLLESIILAGNSIPGRNEALLPALTERSIMANMFVTLVAGHETISNTLTFTLLLLAIYPEYQRDIQADLDRVLGVRPHDEWNSEEDYTVLQRGILGAVIKETLRLYSPNVFGMRIAVAPVSVTDSQGRQHTIPEGTTCMIDFAAAFQKVSVWEPDAVSNNNPDPAQVDKSHAIHFNPRRWMESNGNINTDYYWPFGSGYRKCPARHFAQIEMVGVLVTIFKDYSLELKIEDNILQRFGGDKEEAWKHKRDLAMQELENGVKVNLNVYMSKELPITIIRRI